MTINSISIDFRNPTPSHCEVAIFVNGAQAGVITLRQDELMDFQSIILDGAAKIPIPARSTGKPNYPGVHGE